MRTQTHPTLVPHSCSICMAQTSYISTRNATCYCNGLCNMMPPCTHKLQQVHTKLERATLVGIALRLRCLQATLISSQHFARGKNLRKEVGWNTMTLASVTCHLVQTTNLNQWTTKLNQMNSTPAHSAYAPQLINMCSRLSEA